MDRLQANQLAEDFLQGKLRSIQAQLDDLKDGIASDSKSTAGDKHETARAMAQLEQEQLAVQLKQVQDHLQVLQQARRVRLEERIAFGSLIQSNKGWFYLSSGIGAIPGNLSIFCLSVHTPMAQALIGRKKGDTVQMNAQIIEIIDHR